MVAMATPNWMDKDMSHQIVSRQILGKVTQFGGFCLHIRKLLAFKLSVGTLFSPTPKLNRVKAISCKTVTPYTVT